MAKSKYDIEAIEADYRAGQLSLRAIADKHGCSEGSIRKWALKYGWSRDLSEKVKVVTKAKIAKTHGTRNVPPREDGQPFTEEQIVEQASNSAVELVSSHIQMAADLRSILGNYTGLLRDQVQAGRVAVQLKDGTVVDIDVPLEYVGKCINSATQSFERLVKIERQAFSLDEDKDESTKGKTLDELLAEVAPDDLQDS
ncbi:hypothetical protein CMO91_00455 [Candidatus Woesearchaeota archaeon]|nr:hypothetical protein [Candidatus Woesearchaeota archaeon]